MPFFSQLDPSAMLTLLLSAIIFLPALGAALLCFMPGNRPAAVKRFSLAVTVVVFLLTVYMAVPSGGENTTGR
ncbi:MAG: hypothetical protein ACWGMZ_01615, partial [Thermoguttaceae bacterium]